jgi:hypothetical protein
MTLKPPTKTFPKLVMKEWPERFTAVDYSNGDDWHVEIEYEKNPDGTISVKGMRKWRTTIDGLSSFTRVVEETGILDQGRSQKEKSPFNDGSCTKSEGDGG